MKKAVIFFGLITFMVSVQAQTYTVKITSLTNIKGNGALEACGVVEDFQNETILITLKHDESTYTTLTDDNGQWCQVIKRWTFNGKTNATARKL